MRAHFSQGASERNEIINTIFLSQCWPDYFKMAPDNVKHYKSGEMRSPEFIPVEKPGSGDLGSQDFKFDVAWGHFDVAIKWYFLPINWVFRVILTLPNKGWALVALKIFYSYALDPGLSTGVEVQIYCSKLVNDKTLLMCMYAFGDTMKMTTPWLLVVLWFSADLCIFSMCCQL